MATTKDAKLLRQTKFPIEFNQKVDMKKVNVEVMKKWIAGRISEILGNEDDVVIELCFNLLEESRFPDIKDLQIKLTGFLDKDTPKFCKELWNLCLSAQSNAQGVPKELLEAKKMELIQEKIESEKAAAVARQRKETDQARERNVDSIRQRERNERGRGGGGPPGRGGYDRRPPPRNMSRSQPYRGHRQISRSPPRRRGSPARDDYRDVPRRDRDLYIPRGRPDRYEDRRRRRSRSLNRTSSPKRHRNTSSPSPVRNRAAAVAKNGRSRKASATPSGASLISYSRSRSRSRSPPARPARRRTSPSLSRSRSPPARRERRKRTPSPASDARSGSRSRSKSPPAEKSSRKPRAHDRTNRSPTHSRSRSRTPTRAQRKKRQRSLERYAPAGSRRRRNSSSSSSSSLSSREGKRARKEKKKTTADEEEE